MNERMNKDKAKIRTSTRIKQNQSKKYHRNQKIIVTNTNYNNKTKTMNTKRVINDYKKTKKQNKSKQISYRMS